MQWIFALFLSPTRSQPHRKTDERHELVVYFRRICACGGTTGVGIAGKQTPCLCPHEDHGGVKLFSVRTLFVKPGRIATASTNNRAQPGRTSSRGTTASCSSLMPTVRVASSTLGYGSWIGFDVFLVFDPAHLLDVPFMGLCSSLFFPILPHTLPTSSRLPNSPLTRVHPSSATVQNLPFDPSGAAGGWLPGCLTYRLIGVISPTPRPAISRNCERPPLLAFNENSFFLFALSRRPLA